MVDMNRSRSPAISSLFIMANLRQQQKYSLLPAQHGDVARWCPAMFLGLQQTSIYLPPNSEPSYKSNLDKKVGQLDAKCSKVTFSFTKNSYVCSLNPMKSIEITIFLGWFYNENPMKPPFHRSCKSFCRHLVILTPPSNFSQSLEVLRSAELLL